jgi:protein involved in polysaccharide export with SLBB domain
VFAVIGAVEKPGNYFISRRVHLLELLAYAGGPSKESGTRVLVARAGSNSNCKDPTIAANDDDGIEVMDFKLRDIQEGKQTLWMQAGDVVSVLDADIVYVYGNVNKQGALKIREPITLTQAIASAEGLKPAAKRDKIRVLRQTAVKADREEFIYDLGQIDKGKARDHYLEPNDIVAVSEDKVKSILNGITKTIKNSVPSAAYRF